jgi:YggT family protein
METLFGLLYRLIDLYSWALIIYILLSWFPNARESSFGHILSRICEPYLEPFRRFVPPLGMIDISPIVAIFVLKLATAGLAQLHGWLV